MCNVGGIDRVLRIIAGIAILAGGFMLKSWWGLIGIIPLTTGIFGFCPLYRLVGISTCKVQSKTPSQ